MDIPKSAFPVEVLTLLPTQEVFLPVELVIGSYKQIKFDIRHDAGAYVALWQVQDWDCFVPYPLSSSMEFQAHCQRLKGFSELKKIYTLAQLSLTYNNELEYQLYEKLASSYQMYQVQGCGIGELQFTALIRKQPSATAAIIEEKVYLTVTTSM